MMLKLHMLILLTRQQLNDSLVHCLPQVISRLTLKVLTVQLNLVDNTTKLVQSDGMDSHMKIAEFCHLSNYRSAI